MGADTLIIYYGARATVPSDDAAQIDELESRRHWTQQRARSAGLDHWWGRLTDGADIHVLIGKQIGVFGVENEHEMSIDSSTMQQIADEVQAAFQRLGIKDAPQLHVQLEAQY